MQEFVIPLFTKGRVVKKENLDSLRDFPMELSRQLLLGMSDGILCGFDMVCQQETLRIGAGALHYGGEIYLTGEENLPFTSFDEMIAVKLGIIGKIEDEDGKRIRLRFIVDRRLETEAREWELGRFSLSKGAVLRVSYKGVEDFKTPYNTLDLTHVCFAGEDGITLHPKLLKYFAEKLLEAGHKEVCDLTFSFACFNQRVVARRSILWYLACKQKRTYQELPQEEMIRQLMEIPGSMAAVAEPQKRVIRGGPSIF